MQAFRVTDYPSIRHTNPAAISESANLHAASTQFATAPARALCLLDPRRSVRALRTLRWAIRTDLVRQDRGPRSAALQQSRLAEASRGASLLTGSGLTLAFLIIGVVNASLPAAPWLLATMLLCWLPALLRYIVDPGSRSLAQDRDGAFVSARRTHNADGRANMHVRANVRMAVGGEVDASHAARSNAQVGRRADSRFDVQADPGAVTRSIRLFTVTMLLQALALGALGAVSLRFGNTSAQMVTHACLVAALAMAPGTIGTLPSVWTAFNVGILASSFAGLSLMRPQWATTSPLMLVLAVLAFALGSCWIHARIRARTAQTVRIERLSRRLDSVQAQARRMTQHLEQRHAEMSVLLDNSNLAMLLVRNQRIVRASAAAIELFGPDTESMDIMMIMARIKRDNDDPMDSIMRSTLLGRIARAEIRLFDDQGQPRWYALVCAPVPEGETGHAIWTFFDQTDAVRGRVEATRSAATDMLTGLPNRTGLMRYMQQLQKSRQAPRHVTLGFIDLNGFKSLNDRFGHAVGDQVLRQFGQGLAHAIGHHGCAARLGGDEFVLVVPAHDGIDAARAFARAALDTACAPVDLPGGDRSVTPAAALGLCDYALDGGGFDEALLLADHAMYKAKRDRRSRTTRASKSLSSDTRTGNLFAAEPFSDEPSDDAGFGATRVARTPFDNGLQARATAQIT